MWMLWGSVSTDVWDEVEQSVIDDGIDYSVADMGGATDFKVGGYKTGFASGASEKKNLYPHFSKCGVPYKQANIYISTN